MGDKKHPTKKSKKLKTVQVKTILLNRNVFEGNDKYAQKLREELHSKGVFLVNVMSSPGAGKTTTLVKLINNLSTTFNVGVMEADIDDDVDAQLIAKKTGAKSIQLHTGGMCHMDAEMTRQGLEEFGVDDLDIIFIENVGNLVCPAEFDTGAHLDIMILSVPEGDDKPLKYPLVFEKSKVVIINKIDTINYFNFDLDRCKQNILMRNKTAQIFPISAKSGDGVDALTKHFMKLIKTFKNQDKISEN